ncbi:MAG TPA: hypothetical protein VMT42_06170 [candidate division Zixibacteria bacterium]|nr:hypothetical protein [candidate division Zixibacteria bacterium]
MKSKTYFTSLDVALTGMFCALWIAVNLFLGPLSFSLTGLPVLHAFGIFFTLLLVAWVTGRFGTSSMAGIIGSIFAILLGAPVLIVCFCASAVVFDVLMFANHHRIRIARNSLAITAIVTMLSAYLAGILIIMFFQGGGLQYALTFWGVWTLVGGILALAITLPIIIALEKANVRKIKGDRD